MEVHRKTYCWHLGTFLFVFLLLTIRPHSFGVGERIVSLPKTLDFDGEESYTASATTTSPGVTGHSDYSEDRGDTVTEEDVDVDGDGDGDGIIYCEGKTVRYDSDDKKQKYGNFVLPRVRATQEGTRVILQCPLGVKSVGAVSIYKVKLPPLKPSTIKPELTEQDSPGLTSFCSLDKNLTTGKWSHVVVGNLNNCREQDLVDLGKEMRAMTTSLEAINSFNMKQAVPKFQSLLRYACKDYSSAEALVESVSRLLTTTDIFNGTGLAGEGTRKILFELIESYAQNAVLLPGQKVSLSSDVIAVETVVFPNGTEEELQELADSYYFNNMRLPFEALSMARLTFKQPRVQLIAYSNDLFFHWGRERTWLMGNSSDSILEEELEFTGNWRVLSMHIDGSKIENLTEPIVYTLPVTQKVNNSQWVCVFWDTEERKWSSRGMKNIRLPNGTLQCESSHLTAFSVLLDPLPMSGDPLKKKPDDETDNTNSPSAPVSQLHQAIHSHILSILSSVGSALSMTGLAITVLTFALFRCLRKERSNRILLNLSVSLFFLHLMSLVSERNLWSNECLIPSLLLHYLLLSSISWMLVEALHMHNLLISVFVQPQSRFLTKRSICAWGIPLVVVTICVCLDPEVYKAGRGEWCIMAAHLNPIMYYISYLGPAALMLLINAFVFVRILRVLCEQGANVRKQSKIVTPDIKCAGAGAGAGFGAGGGSSKLDWKSIKSTAFLKISPTQVKGAVTVMVLLGVGWTLGFLAIGPFQLVFRYLFTLCNAGQGLFIFLFRVLLHPQASRTWRKAIMKGFSLDSDFASIVSSRKSQGSPSCSSTPTSFISPSSSVTNTLTRSDPMSSKLAKTLAAFLNASQQQSLQSTEGTDGKASILD